LFKNDRLSQPKELGFIKTLMEVSPVLEDFRYYQQLNLFLDVSFKRSFR